LRGPWPPQEQTCLRPCVSIFFVYLERKMNCAFLILGSGFVV